MASVRRRPLLTLLQERFPDSSKEELFARILCGEVLLAGGVCRDPKQSVSRDAEIEFLSKSYVSRGGEKLASAYAAWEFPIAGKVFVDAGASTGGFTDFLLQHGAQRVHAVDVGYNQLDFRLRTDSRVINHERTNILDLKELDPEPDAAVGDLSFRSLRRAAAHTLKLTREGWGVFLLKPQFELGGAEREFDGVVSDQGQLGRVVLATLEDLASEGLSPESIIPAGIKGRKGNQEYLLRLRFANEAEELIRKQALMLWEGLFGPQS